MSLIADIFAGSLGSTVEAIGSTVKKFVTTDKDRMAMQTELEEILQRRDSEVEQTIRTELAAKERVLVAELQQGDTFTKRARPSVVYFGLAAITVDLVFRIGMVLRGVPVSEMPSTFIPTEFWYAWGGIVSTWVIGRSAEKRGARNKVTDFITGAGSRLID
jgi:hypothetical protein